MSKIQLVKDFYEAKKAYNDAKKTLEDYYPDIDELLEDCHKGADERNWSGVFGALRLMFVPKSRENIALAPLKKEDKALYELLKAKGYITESNYLERRIEEV